MRSLGVGLFLPGLLWATFLFSGFGLRGQKRRALTLKLKRSRAREPAGDAAVESDERPVCAYGAMQGFSGHVQVFVSTDNTRFLEFDNDGVGSQTEVKCKGPVPPDCNVRSGPEARADWSLNTTQSCDSLDCPCDRDVSSLDFSYMVDMMEEVIPGCESRSLEGEAGPLRVLLVGLGGGAMPSYLLSKCPEGSARVESVEYDPRVVQAAENFFGFHVVPGRNEVETDDGGRALARRAMSSASTSGSGRLGGGLGNGNPAAVYDVVLVDCFGDGGEVPNSCKDDAFIGNVKLVLKPGGKLVQQIWSPQYGEVIKHYETSFGAANVKGTDIELGVNHLIIARKAESVGESFYLQT